MNDRADSLNQLAYTARESLDLVRIFDWVGLPYKSQGQIEPIERIR